MKLCFSKLNITNQTQLDQNLIQQLNDLQQKALNDCLKELIKQVSWLKTNKSFLLTLKRPVSSY